jgi:hypothetical protein
MNFGNKSLDIDGKNIGGILFYSGRSYTYFTNKSYVDFLLVLSITNDHSLVL